MRHACAPRISPNVFGLIMHWVPVPRFGASSDERDGEGHAEVARAYCGNELSVIWEEIEDERDEAKVLSPSEEQWWVSSKEEPGEGKPRCAHDAAALCAATRTPPCPLPREAKCPQLTSPDQPQPRPTISILSTSIHILTRSPGCSSGCSGYPAPPHMLT